MNGLAQRTVTEDSAYSERPGPVLLHEGWGHQAGQWRGAVEERSAGTWRASPGRGACFFQTWGALAPGDAKQDVTELPCPGRGRLLEWAVLAAGGLMGLGAGAPG